MRDNISLNKSINICQKKVNRLIPRIDNENYDNTQKFQ